MSLNKSLLFLCFLFSFTLSGILSIIIVLLLSGMLISINLIMNDSLQFIFTTQILFYLYIIMFIGILIIIIKDNYKDIFKLENE